MCDSTIYDETGHPIQGDGVQAPDPAKTILESSQKGNDSEHKKQSGESYLATEWYAGTIYSSQLFLIVQCFMDSLYVYWEPLCYYPLILKKSYPIRESEP